MYITIKPKLATIAAAIATVVALSGNDARSNSESNVCSGCWHAGPERNNETKPTDKTHRLEINMRYHTTANIS